MKSVTELIDKLHEVFRKKMDDVFAANHHVDPFSKLRAVEFNAWQTYLRDALLLEVIDAGYGDEPEVTRCGGELVKVRILNPSNGLGYGREFILVPVDLAMKAVMLGGLPDKV